MTHRIPIEAITAALAKASARPWTWSPDRLLVETTQVAPNGDHYGLNAWTPDEDAGPEAITEGYLICLAVNNLEALKDEILLLRAGIVRKALTFCTDELRCSS